MPKFHEHCSSLHQDRKQSDTELLPLGIHFLYTVYVQKQREEEKTEDVATYNFSSINLQNDINLLDPLHTFYKVLMLLCFIYFIYLLI